MVDFFQMSLRGQAAAWFTGLAAMTRGRPNICIYDLEGLKTAFRQQHSIGGTMFYLDFKELMQPRKSERMGPYIARIRKGMDKFLLHFGPKLYEMAFPKLKSLLRDKRVPSTNKDVLWRFHMPTDVIAEVDYFIAIAADGWPTDMRERAELYVKSYDTPRLTRGSLFPVP